MYIDKMKLAVYIAFRLSRSFGSIFYHCVYDCEYIHSEIKCRIAMATAAFNKKRTLFTSTLDLELTKKLMKCYVWSTALYGVETWTLRAVDQKHLESFEMWCSRRMEKITWTDHVRNEDVLHMKVVSLSAPTHRPPLPTRKYS